MEDEETRIARLERKVENYHRQHKKLKAKVTALARRLRAIEPFAYAEERDGFVLAVLDAIERNKEKN